MRKKAIILIGLLVACLVLFSCSDEVNGRRARHFFADRELTLNPGDANNPINIEDGEDLVFRYLFAHPHDPEIADDELDEIFIFSVPANQTSFEITTEDIAGASIFPMSYYRLCFCFFEFPFSIVSVQVDGRKINDSKWEVSFEVTVSDGDHSYHLKDEGIYELHTRVFNPSTPPDSGNSLSRH